MRNKIVHIVFYVMMIFYVFLVLDLFFRFHVISSGSNLSYGYNLIPFKTIWGYLGGDLNVSRSRAVQNILGNIAVLIPLGLYLQVLLKNKTCYISLRIIMITAILIEMIQFMFGLGACDIDDFILNVSGGVLGIAGYKGMMKLFCEEEKTRAAITLVSVAVGMPVIFLYLIICFNRYF